jgi:beta-lactamase superfamily II metal-dependent hydrolase
LLATSVLKDRSPSRNHLHDDLNRLGYPKGLYERGDFIHVGPHATMRVLYPPAGLKRSLAEDMALVVQLDVDGRRALFMSDSGFTTERWLLEHEPDLRSDLLIKGHHSKDFSGTPDFLARVQPQAVICGQLGYGKPPSTLDPWVQDTIARGITVFRQDTSGAVQVELRKNVFTLHGYLNGQSFQTHPR